MYEYLEYHGVRREVIEAMNKIDRKIFVSEEYEESAYLEVPLPIGFGQTISAPHMVGIMCSALNLSHGDKVLEIGTGSGYNAAVISLLVGDDGHVYTIERIAELAEIARRRMELLRIKNVTVVVG
ncbi:MAG: methyltransferase domain-containing protein, partial [Fervidobacterium sp.]